jgi:hypothetical protein
VTAANRNNNSFRLTVLNPGGRDPRQDFSAGINPPDDGEHAPINFHAYAACTRGVFHRETKAAIAEGLPVLLLLRGDFRAARDALRELQRHGLTTAISFKETGLHQIGEQLSDPKRAAIFREVCEEANGFLAATPDAANFWAGAKFIPTPYPMDDSRWDFSRAESEREGIFVGTREWDVPSRNHLAAVALAAQLGESTTMFEEEPARCRKLWDSLGGEPRELNLQTKRLPYRRYLEQIAQHKIVLQADKSAVPGQVAGDALLCRIPCVGGDGAIEQIAFPRTCGFGRSLGELRDLAARLLRDRAFYRELVAESQELARADLGFEKIAAALADFFAATTR